MKQTQKIKQLGVQRYLDERWIVRCAAIQQTPEKGTALELYSGKGGMTGLYKQHFEEVITNDVDKNSNAQFKLKASDFIQMEMPVKKIDLVDFDAYGNPMYEIQKFFATVRNTQCPITIVVTDGLGLHMKRCRDESGLKQRFLLKKTDEFNLRKSWLYHPQMTKLFMERLAKKYGMRVRPIHVIQGKGKNFVFSSWLFTKNESRKMPWEIKIRR